MVQAGCNNLKTAALRNASNNNIASLLQLDALMALRKRLPPAAFFHFRDAVLHGLASGSQHGPTYNPAARLQATLFRGSLDLGTAQTHRVQQKLANRLSQAGGAVLDLKDLFLSDSGFSSCPRK